MNIYQCGILSGIAICLKECRNHEENHLAFLRPKLSPAQCSTIQASSFVCLKRIRFLSVVRLDQIQLLESFQSFWK